MPKCIDCKHCVDDRMYGYACDAHGCRSAIFNDLHEPGECGAFVPRKPKEEKPNDIISQIGVPATLEQLAEECCELGQAALKMARKLREENPTPKTLMECQEALQEELGDVLLCMDLIRVPDILGSNDCIDESAKLKLKRWLGRLKEVKQ